jgi:photosystem II stability/assembly factor-like uncharacterized protein
VQRKSSKLFSTCLIVLLCAIGAIAQTTDRGWEWQNPLPQGNAIAAIRFAKDNRHGWAVGADGVVLYTDDGGYSWANQPARSVASLNGLYVFDRRRAIAVGARGTVLRTTNAGQRWRRSRQLRKIISTQSRLLRMTRRADGRSAPTARSSQHLTAA